MVHFFSPRMRTQAMIGGIVALGACFIFFRLTRADFLSDDAHYSARALVYIDFLSSTSQTTPLQWFSSLPWWAWLSFHDAPPLVFLIQHGVFRVIGPTAFAARVPFALAGVATLTFFLLLVKELYGARVARWSGFMLVFNPYFIWASRIGLLEGIELTWIIASLYFFMKSRQRTHFLLWWGASLGFAFLSKYTSFYLIPMFGVLLIGARSTWLRQHEYRVRLIAAVGIVVLLCAPVIMYNMEMWRARGHFDLQFSRLLGQDTSDWLNIDRGVGIDVPRNVQFILSALQNAVPIPLLALASLGMVIAVREQIKKRADHFILLLNVACLFILFSLVSPTVRYLSLMNPFLALSAGLCLDRLSQRIRGVRDERTRRAVSIGWAATCGMLIGYLIIVVWNTNHAYDIHEVPRFLSMPIRAEQRGFNQLDEYMALLIGDARPPVPAIIEEFKKVPRFLNQQERRANDSSLRVFDALILYDENMNWFGRYWSLERWMNLTSIPIYSISNARLQYARMGAAYRAAGFEVAYLVLPAGDNILPLKKMEYYDYGGIMRAYFSRERILPRDIIRDPSGQERFHVYYLPHLWETLESLFAATPQNIAP